MGVMTAGLRPRPHQIDALADLTRAFAVHDRAQLVMACGSGKTLVGRWHAQAVDATRVLVLVPSLALVAQTLREWRRPYGWRFDALVVCSDASTTEGAAERQLTEDGDGGEVDARTWEETRAKVTTDPAVAELFFTQRSDRPQVVFSTYHSSPVVAAAQARTDATFDLVICDEAHRLAGRPSEAFLTAGLTGARVRELWERVEVGPWQDDETYEWGRARAIDTVDTKGLT